MHRVVVTGMGIVTSLGLDLATAWRRLAAGENGISRITGFDASEYSCKVAGEIPPFELRQTGLESIPARYCRRDVHVFLKAVDEAYSDSGLADSDVSPRRVGVVAGASVNYVQTGMLRHYYRFRRSDAPFLDLERFGREGSQPERSFFLRMGDLMAAVPAKVLGLAGPNSSVDTACAASAHAVGEAFRLIQRGRAVAMVAGGAAALVRPLGILAFAVLGALSKNPDPNQASRPFDRKRDGFVMGEGAGAVVLERWDHARRRRARVYGELVGFGSTVNAYNLTDPSPDGICEASAMDQALREARMDPECIDYIAAHGTSTAKNDEMETTAIKKVFGRHAKRLMVSSNKGQIGHTISAAGVCNLIFTLKAASEGFVPPTLHYANPDPACDLDYVPNQGRGAKIRAALVNAFAFGGQNAVLAVRKW